MSEELPFQLMAWIKKEQKDKEEHAAKMALKNAKDDEVYTNMLATLIKLKLKLKDMQLVMSMLEYKSPGKNYSPGQRSCITGMYYKQVS